MEDIHSFFLGIDIITDIRSILLYEGGGGFNI